MAAASVTYLVVLAQFELTSKGTQYMPAENATLSIEVP